MNRDKLLLWKRIFGYSALAFFVAMIISFAVTVNTSTTDENGEAVYDTVALAVNMIFTFGFVILLILFFIFWGIHGAKSANGPAIPLPQRESFKDEYEPGVRIEKAKIGKIDYAAYFKVSCFAEQGSIRALSISTGLGIILCLVVGLSVGLVTLFYALLVLTIVLFILLLIYLFVFPSTRRRKEIKNHHAELEIYEDKILYIQDDRLFEVYYSQFVKAYETKNSFAFIYPDSGYQAFYFSKANLKEKTIEFLRRKIPQIENYNHPKKVSTKGEKKK